MIDNTITSIRRHLDDIQRYYDLNQERGNNDIRRRLIAQELSAIEREIVELRRKNQQ